jgi:hypothetical protein
MRLGLDKLTISKLDNIELRKITRANRSNINSTNQTLSMNKLEQKQK